jgi:hypothetical protein
MYHKIETLKQGDWSLNLEDDYYEAHIEEMLTESVDAVRQTKQGHYVNIVTPGANGDPRSWLIPELLVRLEQAELPIQGIRIIDQCGCGGYVTRVYR